MDIKMSSYQRRLLVDGLIKGTEYNKLGKNVINSLVDFHNPSPE